MPWRLRAPLMVTAFCLTALGVAAGPLPSYADCGEIGVSTLDTVFVGEALTTRRGYTKFGVDEVWAGPDLASVVWVQSGTPQSPWPLFYLQGVSSSVDAEFTTGERYVVGSSGNFSTNACSSYSADDDSERPPKVRRPVADGSTGTTPPLPGWVFNLTALAVIVGLIQGVRLLRREDDFVEDEDLEDDEDGEDGAERSDGAEGSGAEDGADQEGLDYVDPETELTD